MNEYKKVSRIDYLLLVLITALVLISVFVLNSVSTYLFPSYYIYIAVGFMCYFLFSKIRYEIVEVFSKQIYVVSILLLVVTLVVGQITRGAVRWIPILGYSFQPAEIVRPFIFIYLASFLSKSELSLKLLVKSTLLFLFPFVLIFIQPSLSVSVVYLVGFLGILISLGLNKKILLVGSLLVLMSLPLFYNFLAPYQKERITNFVNPYKNPYGSGYNSIQSMIAVGSGGIVGKGLGKGVQTQLAFLPEMHTDFIFASIAEELGFFGASATLILVILIIYRLTFFISNSTSPPARAFTTGLFFSFLFQVFVNVSMNLGIFPVSGLPLPFVSAGGSSFISTMIAFSLASTTNKNERL